jgi:hypothetical protein
MKMKTLGAHFKKDAADHRATAEDCRTHASCCKGLAECMKLAGITKNAKMDYHDEMATTYSKVADRHDAAAERCDKMAEACNKASDAEDLAKIVGAVSASVMEKINEKLGKMVQPTAVRGAFLTEDPTPVLVGRQGGPSLPVPTDAIDPAFRNLFTE